ncbi:hypothetical protein [Thermopetrobacter sp. TC1]|uniref:J domain-containing protein n=1 Tax=Thermopetrobacter sp. TC1 TaxID=1495045 RepID=UPI00056FEE92|nr:hypothetical protein [Thermopetrobacter sp. TC1]
MLRILPFILLLLLAWLALKWFLNTPPERLARLLRRGGRLLLLAGSVALGIFLTARGLGEVGLPLIAYAFSAWQRGWWPWGGPDSGAGSQGGSRGGRRSEVRTTMLRMELDHASGRMDGEVLAGTFAGRWLSDLSDAELKVLHEECARAGDQSLKLLEAWLARERPGFDAGHGAAGGTTRGADAAEDDDDDARMTPERAREILGLGPKTTEEEIRAAHRRLMKVAHPDMGGSAWLARQINLARDILLRELRRR